MQVMRKGFVRVIQLTTKSLKSDRRSICDGRAEAVYREPEKMGSKAGDVFPMMQQYTKSGEEKNRKRN